MLVNNRTNKIMSENFGRVLISSVYAKVDNPKKNITMIRVPVRTEEEYMEQHKILNKNHGGLCEIVGLDEFQVKPYFDLDPKGDFDYSVFDAFEEDIRKIYNNDIFVSGREAREEKDFKGNIYVKHSRRFYVKARITYKNIPIVFKELFEKYKGIIDTSVYCSTRVMMVPLSDRKKDLDVPVLKHLKGSIFDCCATYIEEDYEDLDELFKMKSKQEQKKEKEIIDDEKLFDEETSVYDGNLNFTEIMTKLSNERATEYNSWMLIGLTLINLNIRKIITRAKLYELFDLFSSKADNYHPDGVNSFIETNISGKTGKGYGIKYLLDCLKIDNEEYYKIITQMDLPDDDLSTLTKKISSRIEILSGNI